MIVIMGYRLTRKAFAELIDTSLDIELVGQVKALIEGNECVREIHSLRSRSMGGLGYVDARHSIKAAKQTHSSLLESNAWHHRSDAMSIDPTQVR